MESVFDQVVTCLVGYYEDGIYGIFYVNNEEIMPPVEYQCKKEELYALCAKDFNIQSEQQYSFNWFTSAQRSFSIAVSSVPDGLLPDRPDDRIDNYKLRFVNFANEQILNCLAKITQIETGEMESLLKYIMQQAKQITLADRFSVWFADQATEELTSIIFDGQEVKPDEKITVSMDTGVVGHVARTGEIYITQDIQKDPNFCRRTDKKTGYVTRGILCFPIRSGAGEIIGVGQLCNKKRGNVYSPFNEKLALRFVDLCAATVQHFLLYQEAIDAHNRATLASELLVFHMQVADEDVDKFIELARVSGLDAYDGAGPSRHPSTYTLKLGNQLTPDSQPNARPTVSSRRLATQRVVTLPDAAFDTFTYLSRHCRNKELAVIQAIGDLGLDAYFNVPLETLCRFTMRTRRGYRENPYHNWTHAFSVFHFAYLLVKRLDLISLFGELACFSFLIAALCHDLDHRGTNSAFEVSSESSLAALYSSKGSVLERHHFSQTMALLSVSGCNIFGGMSAGQNKEALDYVHKIILATDLSQHFKIISQLEALAVRVQTAGNLKNYLDSLGPQERRDTVALLLCLLMTSSDLSDQTKDWATTKNTAKNIYDEFFCQGDREKDMGLSPIPNMDRDKACVPRVQISFMEHIAEPVYTLLSRVWPATDGVIKRVELNRERWQHVSNAWDRTGKPSSESLSVLTDGFDRQVFSSVTNTSLNPFT